MGTGVEESVRALLQGDLMEYADRTAGLDEQGWNVFGEMVGSAFHRAVGQRFGPHTDPGEIGRFVEEARRPYLGTAVDVDAESAAALVRSVLGDDGSVGPVLERFDEPDLARIELVLLRRLIADAGLTGAAFDRFLEETGSDARPWTGADGVAVPAETAGAHSAGVGEVVDLTAARAAQDGRATSGHLDDHAGATLGERVLDLSSADGPADLPEPRTPHAGTPNVSSRDA